MNDYERGKQDGYREALKHIEQAINERIAATRGASEHFAVEFHLDKALKSLGIRPST